MHTCNFDHPAAIGFYRRSGFTPYKLAVEVEVDPRARALPAGASRPPAIRLTNAVIPGALQRTACFADPDHDNVGHQAGKAVLLDPALAALGRDDGEWAAQARRTAAHGEADAVHLVLLAHGFGGALAGVLAVVEDLELLQFLEGLLELGLGVVELVLQFVGRAAQVVARCMAARA